MTLNLKYPASSNLNWTKEYLIEILTGGNKPVVTEPQIINAFLKIDRKDFVPEKLQYLAYNDISLDVGNNVMLEKPTTIAQILESIKPKFGGKYLVVGSGTGYLLAMLGLIAGETGRVFSIEPSKYILDIARQNLKKYEKIRNIELLIRDLSKGLIEKSPFDGILIASNEDEIPNNIKDQLNPNGGVLVALGEGFKIIEIERKGEGNYEEEILESLPV